jgi:hypothetical protein
MPWRRVKNKIYKVLPNGRLKLKQVCKSIENAKAALRLLYMKMRQKGE